MSKRSKRRKKTAISNLTTTISNFETDTIVSNDQDDDALELLDCRTAEDEVIPGAERLPSIAKGIEKRMKL